MGNCGTFDGQKFVCLDKIYSDVVNNKCLVYSFGIANDWSFEEVMAGIGCMVRAFDPTTAAETKPANENITFEAIGLSDKSGTTEVSLFYCLCHLGSYVICSYVLKLGYMFLGMC